MLARPASVQTGIRECRCGLDDDPFAPNPKAREEKSDICERCGLWINPRWTSNDETFGAFMDRVAEALFAFEKGTGKHLVSANWERYRAECEARERAGRGTFGHRSLVRDNPVDAGEEYQDGDIYMHLHILKRIREGGSGLDHPDSSAALMSAYHAFKAWEYAMVAREQVASSTGPGWDE